jgi:hypothetical protein
MNGDEVQSKTEKTLARHAPVNDAANKDSSRPLLFVWLADPSTTAGTDPPSRSLRIRLADRASSAAPLFRSDSTHHKKAASAFTTPADVSRTISLSTYNIRSRPLRLLDQENR